MFQQQQGITKQSARVPMHGQNAPAHVARRKVATMG
jgi:hypothetical protein